MGDALSPAMTIGEHKSGRDVVGRVKVNGYRLDPCFIGCAPVVDRTLVHGASLTLCKKAFDGAVGTSCFFCELRVQCLGDVFSRVHHASRQSNHVAVGPDDDDDL